MMHQHLHNPANLDSTTQIANSKQTLITDINTSNAQQLSSNSISLLGNGFYSIPKQEMHSLNSLNQITGLPSVVAINDLQPGRKYLIQVSAVNQVGSTDAEYNVNTYSLISNELMRTSNKFLQHGQQLSAQLADYTYLLPVCLSMMIISVLLLMVCVVVKRNNQVPNASTSLLYGSIVGNGHKEEQLQMANFTSTLTSKQKQMNCDGISNGCGDTMGHLLITANGTICETMPKLNNNNTLNSNGQMMIDGSNHSHTINVQQHTGLEPLYATVKRPNQARLRNNITDHSHIYSYPISSLPINGNNSLTATMNTLNNLNTINTMNTLNSSMNSSMNNGLSNCASNTFNTNAYTTCNGNNCNGNTNVDAMNCAMNCTNQQTLLNNQNAILNQCLDDASKLMNCTSNLPNLNNSTSDYGGVNGNLSCNKSLNGGQLISNNKMICQTEHEQKMMELNLCQMMR